MKKSFTKDQYSKYVEEVSPKSKIFTNVLKAFLVGGIICDIGQLFINLLKNRGLDNDAVSAITSIIMIFLAALLTGLNVYDEIGKFAGAGSIVPITGFANSVVSPAMEFKSEGYVLGMGAKMFIVAGPVIVYGICTSIIAGIIHYLIS
ncbi:stage V sporulation protein AC [Ruminiclostridium papyrosolvens DSM 2782]|uniref:Stage V sporulation protein AC n=1 Tax=Ruminiclostridium papyrosolvens DSM 2782 TaxID=588581 RepID=F1T8C1_9FIRM|nr:stage V sporulation protein AC [Ruminiclostridium papyrosolvens]EGD49719.1 stage V sporulation protein AC [Ruminiclostridium papyrosolvens DSM 2782]WES33154.1 stage V sporulation protein AC [Ruminiclostridium papyrosolvens DSM 2782]